MKDTISIERLNKVHPLLQARVTRFFNKLEEKGLTPRVTQGLRTIEEQNDLYAQGRTKPGSIVTNAKGGQSWHNYGMAVDIAFLNPNGSVDFNVSKEVGKIGKDCMLEWGGTWTSFKDMPHFQIPGLTSNPKTMSSIEREKVIRLETSKEPQEVGQQVSIWAKESVQKSKTKGIMLNWSNPQGAVSDETYQWVFKKLGVLDTITTEALTREKLAVILDRLHLLD